MLTDYAERKLLGHSVGKGWTAPVSTFVQLYNVITTDLGGGTPVDGAPVQPIRWSAAVTSGDTTSISNSNTIIWSAASTNWGSVTAWAILDSAAGAPNILWYGSFDFPNTVNIGDQYTISAASITLSLN